MALNKTVKINFNTQGYEVHNGLMYLKTTGDANVLLALTDGNGKEIIFNKPISISAITETGMGGKLKFGVYAKTPFDSRLQIGGFSSTIMFNIEYQ
ncbi:TPA: fimbrial protein [Klebsiella aerogenes]